jgi:hypothetical protein
MELSFKMAVYKDDNIKQLIWGDKIMNKLYMLIFCVVILGGCNSAMKESYNSNLYRKWLLVNVSGGIAGDINEINTKIDKHILDFSEDNSITYFYNDSLISKTDFQIEKRKSIYSADELDFIIYENHQAPEAITYLSIDTLIISDNFYDGYTKVYIRSSN